MRVCGRRCDTGAFVRVTLDGARIVRVEPWDGKTVTSENESVLGGADVWVSPGFLDLQVNGFGGHDFNAALLPDGSPAPLPEEAPHRIADLAARHGTAALCPTVLTNSAAGIRASLRHIARACDSDARLAHALPAIHLEGPYLSPVDGPRGAHPLAYIRPPDWDEFQRFQEAAEGRIRLLTLAPEYDGAPAFIERATEAGVTVSLGHTGASGDRIHDAVKAGARMSTHLGNAAHATLPRHPNYLWDQLANDDLVAGVIADGHHLPASVVRVIARVKGPERLCLVSDAVALGGTPPGITPDGLHEVLPSGKIVLRGTPFLAGAGHMLDTCVGNALAMTDLGMAGVTCAASHTPARVLGLSDTRGALSPGHFADLTLFRWDGLGPVRIMATVRAGEIAWRE